MSSDRTNHRVFSRLVDENYQLETIVFSDSFEIATYNCQSLEFNRGQILMNEANNKAILPLQNTQVLRFSFFRTSMMSGFLENWFCSPDCCPRNIVQ